jgi:CRISP-associated protein Cas1
VLPEGFVFSKRRRKPATDPFNLMLNILANMLARDVRAAILKAGLHPGFGVLHQAQDGGEALVHDLMEAFRAPVLEACASALANRKALRPEHFTADGERLTLSREGWRALIRGYEAWVLRPIRAANGENMLWRSLMAHEASNFAASCRTGEAFLPYRMDY